MNSYIEFFDFHKLLAVSLALLLVIGAAAINQSEAQIEDGSQAQARTISDEDASTAVGGDPGSCGIAVGIAAGVAALALGGVTVGIGAAVALSAGFHVAALLCAT